jgi:hypothetical protein
MYRVVSGVQEGTIPRTFLPEARKTFFVMTQLIPAQYTVGAVMGTLLFGLGCWEMGQKGFHGASVKVDEVDPDSLLTPWLITCWLRAVVRGLRRGHGVLRQFYNLDALRSSRAWEESAAYFAAFGLRPKTKSVSVSMDPVYQYSRQPAVS